MEGRGTRRVLVTGGAGFIGSHVVDALRALGDDVAVVDSLATGDRANLAPGVELVVADVSDAAALHPLSRARFDAVVHCASRTKVVESLEKPELYRRVIVDGTRNVVALARAVGAAVLVNISTGGAVYGETPECADEARAIDPPSPYGRYKAEAERLVGGGGTLAVTLRLANVYGPRQRIDLEGGVIAIFTGAWRRGEPITIYGDGSAERDYIYVTDAADAVVAALGGAHRGVYNIGTGEATSVNTLVEQLTALLGPPPGIVHAPARSVEIQRACVDASKAARDGLWRPRTSLAEGLRLTATAG